MSISDGLLNRRTFLAAGLAATGVGAILLSRLPQASEVIQGPITPEFTPELEEIVNLTEAHRGGAILWHNGLMHAYGGYVWDLKYIKNVTNTHEIYDPTKTEPTLKEMPLVVTDMAAFILNDELFSVGGNIIDQYGFYDQEIDKVISFSQKEGWGYHNPFPRPIGSAEAAVVDGAAYIFHGWFDDGRYNRSIFKSKNPKDKWDVDYKKISKPIFPITTAVLGKKIYSLGDRLCSSSDNFFLQIYDTELREVNLKKAPKEFGEYYRRYHTRFIHLFVDNDQLHFIGWNPWNCTDKDISVFTYLPEKNDWKKDFVLKVPSFLSSYPQSAVHDNYVYVTGAPPNKTAYRFKLLDGAA